MVKISYSRKLRKISSGLFGSLLDFSIFSIALLAQAPSKRSPIEIIDRSIRAVAAIRPVNFNRAVYNARHKGYLEKRKDAYRLTKLGRERLSRILPSYDAKRFWDGRLFLVIYDIPEDKKRIRDYLRDYLKRLGSALLQKSVWLTPYNPTILLTEFARKNKIKGLVLVSELKPEGLMGGKSFLEVIRRIYGLDLINDDYHNFCKEVEERKLTAQQIILEYLSILKRDPQLPFELLPGNWWGEDARGVYKKVIATFRQKQ